MFRAAASCATLRFFAIRFRRSTGLRVFIVSPFAFSLCARGVRAVAVPSALTSLLFSAVFALCVLGSAAVAHLSRPLQWTTPSLYAGALALAASLFGAQQLYAALLERCRLVAPPTPLSQDVRVPLALQPLFGTALRPAASAAPSPPEPACSCSLLRPCFPPHALLFRMMKGIM